jgi:predicted DNA-binding transcriptional regulator AlpA
VSQRYKPRPITAFNAAVGRIVAILIGLLLLLFVYYYIRYDFLPKDFYTAGGARLKVRKTWIYEKIRQRKSPYPFPHFRIGRYLRFSWVEVSTWIEGTRAPVKKAAR